MAVVLAAIVVLLVLGLSLLSQFTGSISTVVATDSNIALSDDDINRYRTIVDKYFADNSFERFGFARRNSVLLQYVMNEAPEVSAIKISPSGIASSKVEVTVRQPVAMWINGNQTDFVDSDESSLIGIIMLLLALPSRIIAASNWTVVWQLHLAS